MIYNVFGRTLYLTQLESNLPDYFLMYSCNNNDYNCRQRCWMT